MSAVLERPTVQRKRWRSDFPIGRKEVVPQTGDIMLEGYASTYIEDRDMERIEPGAFDDSAPDYLAKNPMLLYQHNPDWPLGNITTAASDNVGMRVTAVVTQPVAGEVPELVTAYEKLRRGVLGTLSVGGFMWRELRGEIEDPEIVIVRVEWMETSVVSIPANPDAIISAAMKAAKGLPLDTTLTERVQAQMAQLLGMRKMLDPELLAMSEDERRQRYHELARAYERAGCIPPGADAWKGVLEGIGRLSPDERKSAVGLRKMLALAMPVTTQLVGGVKRGRVLSNENERLLREAVERLQSVLSKIESGTDDDEPDKAALVEELKARQTELLEAQTRSGDDGAKGLPYDVWRELEQMPADVFEADYRVPLDVEKRVARGGRKRALPTPELPFADRDRGWDAAAARRNVTAWASEGDDVDFARYAQAFLWVDDEGAGENQTAYRFIVADVIDGRLTYVPRGVFAAANVLSGGRGGTNVPEEGQAALRRSVSRLYARMRERFDDDAIVPPWENE